MKKLKKRIKRLIHNFKSIKWVGPKVILKGVGSVVLFTGFFVALFGLIDYIGGLLLRLF